MVGEVKHSCYNNNAFRWTFTVVTSHTIWLLFLLPFHVISTHRYIQMVAWITSHTLSNIPVLLMQNQLLCSFT